MGNREKRRHEFKAGNVVELTERQFKAFEDSFKPVTDDNLEGIVEKLKQSDKKVQLIYALNGSGKTQLSRRFKEAVQPEPYCNSEEDPKILYYNAYTENLFNWENYLDNGSDKSNLVITSNKLIRQILNTPESQEKIIKNFQRYTSKKLTPCFSEEHEIEDRNGNPKKVFDVTFSFKSDNPLKKEKEEKIKISKGEESNFIWSIFYSLIKEVVEMLEDDKENRDTDQFNDLQYIFIDDPVSSLDDNHLIHLAVDLAELIRSSNFEKTGLKFIISTHNTLFFNVLSNELNSSSKYLLQKNSDDAFKLLPQESDTPFSYHIFLLKEVKKAIEEDNKGKIRKYHFGFMRNILEKTSIFLGYERWQELLPEEFLSEASDDTTNAHVRRLLNVGNHSKPDENESKEIPREVANRLKKIYENFVKSGHTFNEELGLGKCTRLSGEWQCDRIKTDFDRVSLSSKKCA